MFSEDDALDDDTPQLVSKNTSENAIGDIDGEGNYIVQTEKFYVNITNIMVDLENAYKDRVDITNEDDEDQSNFADTAGSSNDIPTSLEEKFTEEIIASSNDVPFVDTSRAKIRADSRGLPHTSEEIEAWYYQELNERERCFVNACAVLHGATLRAIAEATRELSAMRKEKKQAYTIQVPVTPSPIAEVDPWSVPRLDSLTWIYSLGQQDERARMMQTYTNPAE